MYSDVAITTQEHEESKISIHIHGSNSIPRFLDLISHSLLVARYIVCGLNLTQRNWL